MIEKMISTNRKGIRTILMVLLHFIFSILALTLSFLARFDFTLGHDIYPVYFRSTMLVFVPVFLISSWLFGLYKDIWRYFSIHNLVEIIKVSSVGCAAAVTIITISGRWPGYPRSIYLLVFIFYVILASGGRLVIRLFRESIIFVDDSARKILIVGAGDTGDNIARTLLSARQREYIPIGFVDKDSRKHGTKLHGLPVLGGIENISQFIRKYRVHDIFIAIPEATNRMVKEIIDASRIPDWDIKYKTVPSLLDIMSGKLTVNHIREVSIDDLLSRPNIRLDDKHVKQVVAGKSILITGAGGSIGTELCFQVAAYNPVKIIVFDLNEGNAYHIDYELRKRYPHIEIVTYIGSILNRELIRTILDTYKPDHIYHAAAYKHVHLMEWNPASCLGNNVIGTKVLVEEAEKSEVEKFVMISTDKAVHPKGIMGVSKRITERIVLERPQNGKTQFNVVRFGNVLGSSGSVVPLFKKQIQEGGPVTVTHPEITRYFMSIPEAVQLVLQAATLDNKSCIYLLEMGEPVKIIDLAEELIRLSGKKVGDDIEIRYTGLRDGEKLYEELLTKSEDIMPTAYDKIRVQKCALGNFKELSEGIELLEKAIKEINTEKIIQIARSLVPESE